MTKKASCVIPHCRNSSEKTASENVIYQKFPLKEKTRRRWLRAIQTSFSSFTVEENVTPRICSDHFEESNFIINKNGKRILKLDAVPTIFNSTAPKKSLEIVVPPRQQSRRAASKEALKQMQILLEDEDDTVEVPDDDDEVVPVPVVVSPPKKKYKLTHRKSSDGNDREVLVLKSITPNITNHYVENNLDLECWVEELEPCQKERNLKLEEEEKALQSKLDELIKACKGEIVYKGELTTVIEVSEHVQKTIQAVQASHNKPPIVLNKTVATPQPNYQLVMDPRLGLIVGAVPSANQPVPKQGKIQVATNLQAPVVTPTSQITSVRGRPSRGKKQHTPIAQAPPAPSPPTPVTTRSVVGSKQGTKRAASQPPPAAPPATRSRGNETPTQQVTTTPQPTTRSREVAVPQTTTPSQPVTRSREMTIQPTPTQPVTRSREVAVQQATAPSQPVTRSREIAVQQVTAPSQPVTRSREVTVQPVTTPSQPVTRSKEVTVQAVTAPSQPVTRSREVTVQPVTPSQPVTRSREVTVQPVTTPSQPVTRSRETVQQVTTPSQPVTRSREVTVQQTTTPTQPVTRSRVTTPSQQVTSSKEVTIQPATTPSLPITRSRAPAQQQSASHPPPVTLSKEVAVQPATTPSLPITRSRAPAQQQPASQSQPVTLSKDHQSSPPAVATPPATRSRPAAVVANVRPTENNVVGGLTTGTNVKPKAIVDLTSDDGRPLPDSREVSFNKLQGKTFPSLVVVARPHLRVSDVNSDRAKLDAKVKAVLMYAPTKFTEWLIQQGLVKSEQKCSIHSTTQLKLGMYSDVSKFPYSGGYVWISECCPQRFVSVFSGSLFEGSPHPPLVILKILYHWACQTNVQNVTQWVKVDNLYVKGMYTWLRSVCTVATHSHIRKLGGPQTKVEVGVISLGTTSQDGNSRQVKVEVLGILETNSKFLRLRAVEPFAEGDRNYKKRFTKILEPLLQWVHPSSTIVTDLTVDKATLHQMGFSTVIQTTSVDAANSNRTIMEYLRRIVPRMFQNTLSLLSRQIIQQFLDELVWREWFGTTSMQAFDNVVSHLAEQTRYEANQSLIVRLNRVTFNPFKNWQIPTSSRILVPAAIPSTAPKNVDNSLKKRKRKEPEPPRKPTPPPQMELNRPPKSTSPDVPEQMVPLENYYYGTIDNYPPKTNVTLNLKCPFCKEVYDNNIVLMNHLFKHAHNVSKDGQMCRYCLTSVPTANDLLKHIATAHPSETKHDNGFICLICETQYMNPFVLGKHMSKEHCPSELPYQCGTCGYKCSNHKQAIDHFYKQHDNGPTIQCPFCLKSTTVFSSSRNIAQNMHYFIQHLQKHQRKQYARRCGKCNLWFVQKDILKDHQMKMHASQRGKTGLVPWIAPRNGVMVPKSKMDIYPCDAEGINFTTLFYNVSKDLKCKECDGPMDSTKHFPSFESCQNPNCQYSTCCSNAMQQHNSKCNKNLQIEIPVETLPYDMFCICGYNSRDGNQLAKHLAICEKKSAYPSLSDAKSASVTHSMLDVLGLVRKQEETDKKVIPPSKTARKSVTKPNVETITLDEDDSVPISNMKSEKRKKVEKREVSVVLQPSPKKGDKAKGQKGTTKKEKVKSNDTESLLIEDDSVEYLDTASEVKPKIEPKTKKTPKSKGNVSDVTSTDESEGVKETEVAKNKKKEPIRKKLSANGGKKVKAGGNGNVSLTTTEEEKISRAQAEDTETVLVRKSSHDEGKSTNEESKVTEAEIQLNELFESPSNIESSLRQEIRDKEAAAPEDKFEKMNDNEIIEPVVERNDEVVENLSDEASGSVQDEHIYNENNTDENEQKQIITETHDDRGTDNTNKLDKNMTVKTSESDNEENECKKTDDDTKSVENIPEEVSKSDDTETKSIEKDNESKSIENIPEQALESEDFGNISNQERDGESKSVKTVPEETPESDDVQNSIQEKDSESNSVEKVPELPHESDDIENIHQLSDNESKSIKNIPEETLESDDIETSHQEKNNENESVKNIPEEILDTENGCQERESESKSAENTPEEALEPDDIENSCEETDNDSKSVENMPKESLEPEDIENSCDEIDNESKPVENMPEESFEPDDIENSCEETDNDSKSVENMPKESLEPEDIENSFDEIDNESKPVENMPEESFEPDDIENSREERDNESKSVENMLEESLEPDDIENSREERENESKSIENMPEESLEADDIENSCDEIDNESKPVENMPEVSFEPDDIENSREERENESKSIENMPEESLEPEDIENSCDEIDNESKPVENMPEESFEPDDIENSREEGDNESKSVENMLEESLEPDDIENSRAERENESKSVENLLEESLEPHDSENSHEERENESKFVENMPQEALGSDDIENGFYEDDNESKSSENAREDALETDDVQNPFQEEENEIESVEDIPEDASESDIETKCNEDMLADTSQSVSEKEVEDESASEQQHDDKEERMDTPDSTGNKNEIIDESNETGSLGGDKSNVVDKDREPDLQDDTLSNQNLDTSAVSHLIGDVQPVGDEASPMDSNNVELNEVSSELAESNETKCEVAANDTSHHIPETMDYEDISNSGLDAPTSMETD